MRRKKHGLSRTDTGIPSTSKRNSGSWQVERSRSADALDAMSQDDAHAQEEDLIAQRIAEDQGWIRVQTRTFTRWVNENLKTTDFKIEELDNDFGDGLRLIALLQQLAGKPIGARITKKPRIRAQKLENVKICFDFMSREGIEMVNIDNQDVADGNMKLILGLVWHLILHYQIATGFDDDGSKGGPKNRIIKWVNGKINPWGKEIKNLGPDWNHGDILACLVNALAPGLVPDFAEMNPENARDNIDRAMAMALEWMDIPRVIEPEDMMDPNVDELSMMTYLSYFPNAKVKDGAPCVNPGRVIARGPGITGVGLKLGHPAEFEIDASKAGENGRDKIKVEVIGPDGPVKVDLNHNGDLTYTGAYFPEDDGEYHVRVSLLNCPIPKSPFKIGIYSAVKTDVNKVKVEGPGITGEGILPGDPAPFTISYKDAGRGQPKVEVFGPDHQPLNIVEDNDKKECFAKCEYQPGVFGEYTVRITYAGLPLPNSPYKINIKPTVDIGKVKTEGPGLTRCKVSEQTWFKVHTAGAGKGDLKVEILQTDGSVLEPTITDDGKGTFHVVYEPTMVGSYKVSISYGRCKLPKSPFNVTVVPPGDAGEVIVNGDALHGIRVGMTGKLFVDASKAGKGDLKVVIIGPDNKPLTTGLEIISCVGGVTTYGFSPEVAGPYVINVTFSGHPVPGSAFDVSVRPSLDIDRIKLIVDRENPPRISKPYKFTVDCSDAGPGPVLFGFIGDEENDNPDKPRKDILVIVCDDKGNPIKDKKGKNIVIDVKELKSSGIAHFTFTPEIEGPLYLKVQYDGMDVPKSPMRVTVCSGIDISKVRIYGDGITNDTPVRANKPMTFVIDATNCGAGPISLDFLSKLGFTVGKEGVKKDMKITIIGPNGEPMTCDVKKRNDKVFEITILPVLVGQLNIDIVGGANDEHAPRSPLKILVKPSVDASRIVIGGDGIEKDKVPRKDKLCCLNVDAEKAGTAPFSVSVNGVDKTPESCKKPDSGKPSGPKKAGAGIKPGAGKPGDGTDDGSAPGSTKPGFGPDGKPTPGNYIAPDGTIKDDKNKPVKGKDGKPLTCALGGAGGPKSPKTDDNGNLLGPDGKPLIGSDGFPVKTAAGPDGPNAGPDGTLYGNDGKPLLGKDGEPLKAAQMHDGKPLCNNEGEILGPDGKPVTGPNGEPLKSGKTPIGLSVLPDGALMKPNGKPLCGPDGNPLKCGLDGDRKPVIDEKGALCGPDGKPLVGPDGKCIKPGAGSLGPNVKPDGSLVDGSGRPIQGKDGTPLKAAMGSCGKPKVNDNGDIVGPDGKPLLLPLHTGKGPGVPYVGPDGTLHGPDGQPLLGPDGKPLKCGLGPDGQPTTDADGNLLGPDGKPLVGPDGKPIKPGQGPCGPIVGKDGTVYGPDGKPLVGPDGKPLKAGLGPGGKPMTDVNGNLLGPDGKPLKDKNGKPVNPAANGPYVGPDGSVYGPNGKPLLGTDGKPLKAGVGGDGKPKTDENGNLLGPDGKPLKGPDGTPINRDGKPIKAPDAFPGPHIGDDGTVTKTDGSPLLGKDGKPLKAAPGGKPQTDKGGNLVGPDGKPLAGADGKPITSSGGPYGPLVCPDGLVEGPGGSPVSGPDGKPLVCEQNPEGLPCKDGDGNLIGSDGLPIIGSDTKPVVFGKETDEAAKPDEEPSDINVVILGPDDKPIPAVVKDLGDGKFQVQYEPKEEGPHKLDVLAGGEHAPKCPVEVDVKPSLDLDKLALGIGGGPTVGPDGTLYDANGKPLLDKNGKPIKCALGPDGKPLTDKDGNLLGPDGKPLIGPDGKPIKAPKDDDKKKSGKGLDLKINPKDLGVDKLNIKPKGPNDDNNPPGPACGPYIGKDGQVHTPTGVPLRGCDGKPLCASVGSNGKPVTDRDNNLLGPDGIPLIGPDTNPVKLGSGPYGPAVGPDGTPYDKEGKPLVGPDGRPQKGDIGPKGKPLVDRDGNLLNPAGVPVTDKDGKPFTPGAGPHIGPDGTVYDDNGEPLIGSDGRPFPKAGMTPEGNPKFDKDGNVLGSDGKPLKGNDGKPLKAGTGPYAKPDGEVFNSDGSPSTNPNKEPNKAGLGEDGKPITDAKGNLVGPDGKPLRGPDGKPVRPNPNGPSGPGVSSMKPDGSLLGPNGKPLKGADGNPLKAAIGNDGKPKTDPNGNILGKDGKPLIGPDGKPIKPGQGEYGPRVGPDGTVYKPNGEPVNGPNNKPSRAGVGPDGRPLVDDNGNILGPDGLPLNSRDGKPVPASENPYVGPDGTVYKPDGTPIGGGKGGKPLTADQDKNGRPKTDKDGNLLGPDGKPLRGPDEKLLKNGVKPYVSPDGNVMMPNGKPLTGSDKKPQKAGIGNNGSPNVDHKNCVLDPNGQNVNGKDGKPVQLSPDGPLGPGPGSYIGPDGTLYGPDGKPLLGPDGKPLKCALGPDGKPLTDKNGNLLGPDGNPLVGPDGKPIKLGQGPYGPSIGPDGTVYGPDGKPLLGPDGKPLKAGIGPDGKPLCDENGNLLGPDGKPLTDKNGNPVKPGADGAYVGPDGTVYGPNGKPLLGPDGKPLKAMLGPDGKPMTDKDGNILGPDGKPIKGPDGKPVKLGAGPTVGPDGIVYGPDGKPLLGPDGKPLMAALGPDGKPLKDKNGNLIGPDGKPLLGPDGKPLQAAPGGPEGPGNGPYAGSDGTLYGPDGKPLLGPDGKPLKAGLNPDGSLMLDENGNILGPDGKPLIGPDGKPIKPGSGFGPSVGPDGTVYGPDGKPLLGPDGKPLKALLGGPSTDKNGNILGPDGKPLLDKNGNPVSLDGKPYIGPDGTLYGPDGQPILGPDGKPLKCGMDENGNPLFDKNGNLLGPDGKPLIGPDGKPFSKGAVGPDGKVYGPDGKPILDKDGNPIRAGLGAPKTDKDGNLIGEDGNPMVDENGNPVKPGSLPYVGPDGTVYGPDGKPLLGPDGKPLKAGLGPDGKPLYDHNGNLLGPDGKPLLGPDGLPIKTGTGPHVGPDGTVYGPDGKPILGPDGLPLKAMMTPDGKPFTDADGNLLGPDGKPLLGPDGKPIKAAGAGNNGPTVGPDGTVYGPGNTIGPDGTIYGPDGKPIDNSSILGPDGKPLLDKNGNPVKLAGKPSIGPDGTLYGPDGKPILGPDGKPLKCGLDKNGNPLFDKNGNLLGPDGKPLIGPDGKPFDQGAIGPDGSVFGPDGKPILGKDGKPLKAGLGPDGRPLKDHKAPPSTDENGNILGPDGRPLLDKDGNPIKMAGKPYIGPDGILYDEDGNPILGPDGKPLKCGLDENGRPLFDKNGNLLGPDGKPLIGPDGKPFNKGAVGPDGSVYGPDGKPILDKDGNPVKAGLGPDPTTLKAPLGPPDTDANGNLLGPDGKPLLDKDGNPVKLAGKPCIGPDGTLYGPDGKPILGPDGKPLKCGFDKNGNPLFDKDGNLLGPDGKPLLGPDGKPFNQGAVGPNGTVYGPDGKPILDKDGNPLKASLGAPLTDNDGNLLGPDGKPLLGPDGKPVKSGPQPVLGADGKPLKAGLGPDGKPKLGPNGELLGPDGKPLVGPDGKPLTVGNGPSVGPDGTVYGPDGKPLLGPDGKPLKAGLGPDGKPMVDKDGNLLGPDGKPLVAGDGTNGGPKVAKDGTLVGPDGKPLLGPDGKPLKCGVDKNGNPLVDKDGNLLGPDGKPLLGPDGQPIKCALGPDGKPKKDKHGNLLGVDGKPIIPAGQPVSSGLPKSGGPLVGPDGTLLGPDGNALLGPDGKPLKCGLGPDGKPLTDANGNLLGPDGKPLLGADGKPIKAGSALSPDGTLIGPDGKPLLGPDGKPLKAAVGKPLIDEDGIMLGPDGKPLLGPDGKPIKGPVVAPGGTVAGPDGKPLLGPDGKPLICGLGPDGQPLTDANGNILGPDGKPLLGPDGKPIKAGTPVLLGPDGKPLIGPDGKAIKAPLVAPDGTVLGPDGAPLLGPDGKPLKAGFGPDGKPLTDANGNLLGPDGKPLLGPDGKPLNAGTPVLLGPDGEPLVGPDGKAIKGPLVAPERTLMGPDGKPLLGPDGKPLKAGLGPDGRPLTDANGNILGPDGKPLKGADGKPVKAGTPVMLGPDGKPLLGPDGKPISGNLVSPDGTVMGPDGKALLGPDGKPLKAGLGPDGKPLTDANGNILGPDGKPLLGPDGKPLKAGAIVSPDGQLLGPDGKALLGPDGRPLFAAAGSPLVDENGNLLGPDGQPLIGPDGKPIKGGIPTSGPMVGPDGTLLGPDGKPMIGPDGKPMRAVLGPDGLPMVDQDGNLLGPGGKRILGPDGKPVHAGPSIGPDGVVRGPDGRPILGNNGKPQTVMLDEFGKAMCAPDGTLMGADGLPIIGDDGKPINDHCAPPNGPAVGPDGTVYGPDGKPLLGPDGKPLKAGVGPDGLPLTDKDGQLLGPDGKPLKGPRGQPVHAGPCIGKDGVVRHPDGSVVKGLNGQPIKAMVGPDGKLMVGPDGSLLGPDGKPLCGPDGKPMTPGNSIGPDGTLYGPDGQPLLGPDGKPLKCGMGPDGKPLLGPDGALLGPDGKPLVGPDGNLIGADGKPLLGPDGRPVAPGTTVGPDGTVYGPDGKPVLGPDGKPLKAALGPDGKPIRGPGGELLDEDGNPLVDANGKPVKPGSSVGPDGTVYGPDGKPLLGPDGKPLKAGLGPDGKPLVGPDGSLLGPDGKPLLGPDGKPIGPGNDRTHATGLGPDGKPLGPLGADGRPLPVEEGGDMTVMCVGPNGELVPIEVIEEPDGTYSVKSAPGMEGDYVADIIGPDGKKLASIPFHVEPQIDASKIKLGGDSIDGIVKKDRPTSFEIDTSDAGKGPFTASPFEPDTVKNGGIPGVGDKNGPKSPNEEDTDVKVAVIGPNGEPVDCTVVDKGDGKFDVQYKPTKEGPHKVVVTANDDLVPGAPVPVDVYPNGDASKCKASGPGIEPKGLIAGKPGTFKVDAQRAGDGDVEVIVTSPNPKFDANVKVTKRGQGIFDCEYNPSLTGPYEVKVLFAGEEIPGSTFGVKVAPNPNAEKVNVSGKGLKKGYAKKPNKFIVEPNGAEGALNFDVEGPSKCDIDVQDNGDGTVTVVYTPQEAGEYTVNVTLDGAQCPGGPFYPQIEEPQKSDASKVKLAGDGIGNNVKTGVPSTIKIDASDAGPGDVVVNIKGPNGSKVPVKIKDNEDGTYDVTFTPEDVGNHNIDVKFDGDKVPGAPLTVPVKPGIDANKVKCGGEGLTNPRAKHDNQFTIDTSAAGPGDDVTVEIVPIDKNGNPLKGGRKIPVDIKDLGNGVKSCVFNPDEEGPYLVDVKFCGKNPKEFPQAIVVRGPGAQGCLLPNINGIEIEPEQEITIPVDISGAGPGDFKVVCINDTTGEEDTVRVIDGPNLMKNVTMKPTGAGPHTITMTFDDEDLPGGPFTIAVKKPVGADACSMKPSKDGKLFTMDGDFLQFLIDLSTSGPGNLTGIAKTPSGKTINIDIEVDKDTGLAHLKFKPTEKGIHLINLLFNGHPIPGCPFEMDINGPADVTMNGGKSKDGSGSICFDLEPRSLVVVPNLVNCKVVKGQDMKIPIDLTFSGDGNIEITCIHDSTLEHVPAKLIDTPNGKEVQISPKEPGWYTVHLKFNGENLPGSPYKFEVKEPTGADACRIKRGPKSPLKDGDEVTLIVDVSKAGEGQLLGTCKGPDSSNIPVKTRELDNGDIEIIFKPKGDGDHTLNLEFNNRSIPGCPAIINIRHVTPDSMGILLELAPWEVDASAKGAKGVRHPNFDEIQVQLNQTLKFPLDLSASGPGNVEVSCIQEKSKQPCPVTVIPTKQGALEVSVKPLETGPHLLHITFNGVDLPKSPFRFNVDSPSGANAVTLKKNAQAVKVVKDGVQFAIDCSRAGPGVLTAACTGPNGQLVPTDCKKSGSDQLITIKPTMPGLHILEVMWDGQQIPGSPIEIMIDMVDGRIMYELCDILLLLMGAFTVRTPDLSNIQLEINQFIRIPIDCRLAGPGKLQVTCKNEDTNTSIDCEMKKTGDMYEITIKPTDPGKHALNIMWDGKHIPGSPAYFTVKGPAPARLCYILSGADHIKCSKGSISFRCTTKEAGKGELTAIGIDPFGKQFECQVTEEPDLTYAIGFKPEVPGVHNVDVKFNGLSINGSPALIDIKSLPQGDEGGISLELISCRDTTAGSGGTETQVQQKATITLPIPKKDHNGLAVTCKGPDGSDIKCQLGAGTDTGINILFEPKSGGKHTLTVMLNGKNYPGTPVDVEVQGL